MRKPIDPSDMESNVAYFMDVRYGVEIIPETFRILEDVGFTLPLDARSDPNHLRVQSKIPQAYGRYQDRSLPSLQAKVVALAMPQRTITPSDQNEGWDTWLGLSCYFLGKNVDPLGSSKSKLWRDGLKNLRRDCPPTRFNYVTEMHSFFGEFRQAINSINRIEEENQGEIHVAKLNFGKGNTFYNWGKHCLNKSRTPSSQSQRHKTEAKTRFTDAIPPLLFYLELGKKTEDPDFDHSNIPTVCDMLSFCFLHVDEYEDSIMYGDMAIKNGANPIQINQRLVKAHFRWGDISNPVEALYHFERGVQAFQTISDQGALERSVLQGNDIFSHTIDYEYEDAFKILEARMPDLMGVHPRESLTDLIDDFEEAYRVFEAIETSNGDFEDSQYSNFSKLLTEHGAFVDRFGELRTQFGL